jgi:multidrug efflux pump subunit AcrB
MIEWIINKRKIVALFFTMLTVVGILSITQLPKREIPEVEPPIATITTIYPGAQSEIVERYVTNKLEEEIRNVQGIEEITSISTLNMSQIIVELKEGSIPDQTWNLVRQRINNAAASFPDEVETPIFNDDLSMQGVSFYHLLSDDPTQLYNLNDMLERWNRKIVSLPGVSKVVFQGMPENELLIELDFNKMQQLQVSTPIIMGVIGGETVIPPGEWEFANRSYQVQLDNYKDPEDIMKLPIPSMTNKSITIGDVADVSVVNKQQTEYVKYGDQTAVTMTIFMVSGTDVPKLQDQVHKLLLELQKELPETVELKQVYSQAEPVKLLFSSLTTSFIIAVFSVVLICTSGLNFLTSLSVVVAIPISLSIGMIVLPYSPVDLNQITLISVIIVLGILVDDAIVVNENIERMLKRGDSPQSAVINGTKEVSTSIITSTLTVVFTFAPLLLMSGAEGAFVLPLPVVIISTMLASTVVALTIVPIFRASVEYRKKEQTKTRKSSGWFSKGFDVIADVYSAKVLPKVIKHPLLVVIVGIIIAVSSFALIPLIPMEFFPDTDREEVFVEAVFPVNMSIEDVKQEAFEIEEWLVEQGYVKEVSTFVGTNVPRLFGMSTASSGITNIANYLVYVDKSQVVASQIRDQWNENLPYVFPMPSITAKIVESGPPMGSPIAIQISGDSIDTLVSIADEVKGVLSNTEGVLSITDDIGRQLPSVIFTPNRDSMSTWGVSNQKVSEELRLLGEGIPLGEWNDGKELLDVRLKYKDINAEQPIELIRNVSVQLDNGHSVPLASLVDMRVDYLIPKIPHRNLTPTIIVSAYPGERTATEIVVEIREKMERITADMPGYEIQIGGETQAQNDFFIEIGKLFVVVLFLVIIVMMIQFYSIAIPFIILTTVILSITGVLIGLYVTGTGLGFMSIIGTVSLAGIVVRNGIVLIEFIRQRMNDGMDLPAAVQLAGKERIRPILLTSLTTIAGMIPVLFSEAPLFKPLAIAIISGLMFSMFLTLLMVPAQYILYERLIGYRNSKKQLS